MTWLKTVAKAVVAFLTVIVAALAAGQISAEPWVEAVLTSLIAALAVWAVPNTTTS